MSTPDPAQERQRLVRVYSEMPDAQLEDLARQAYSLTEIGREALKAEIRRRKLDIALSDSAQQHEPSASPLVLVGQFRDLPEALVAKSMLESAEIECFLGDDNAIHMDWFWSNALGGVKLFVREEDASSARELLDQPAPQNFTVPGVGEFTQPHCPNCDSTDVSYNDLMKPVAYASLWVGLPAPLRYTAWKCHACGHTWEDPSGAVPDSGDAAPPTPAPPENS